MGRSAGAFSAGELTAADGGIAADLGLDGGGTTGGNDGVAGSATGRAGETTSVGSALRVGNGGRGRTGVACADVRLAARRLSALLVARCDWY
jgi:hypothetical protein